MFVGNIHLFFNYYFLFIKIVIGTHQRLALGKSFNIKAQLIAKSSHLK